MRDDSQYVVGNHGLCKLAQELGRHPVYLAGALHSHFRCSPGELARRHHLNLSLSEVAQD